MGKAEIVHFRFEIVRYSMKTQIASIPFDFKCVRSFSDLRQKSLTCLQCFYFLSETTRPGCNAGHHFGNATLCLQNISNFIAKQMSKKLILH